MINVQSFLFACSPPIYMGRLNRPKVNTLTTHEGGRAIPINPEQQLRRSVMACMLWEDTFYEDGESIADRIKNVIPHVHPQTCLDIAVEARTAMKLRHVPLLIAREMARLDTHKPRVSEVLTSIIQRPDELTEFLAIYWKDGKQPLSKQVKLGLAGAFHKFDAYQLAKYNRPDAIRLRDVLFLCHAKPNSEGEDSLWKQLIADNLPTPDTWEVALSGGADKKATFERMITERKLGAMALLRNLRNMQSYGVSDKVIKEGLAKMKVDRVLPFRFISAARYAPNLEPALEDALFRCVVGLPKIPGKTVILADVSGSTTSLLSGKSQMMVMDAICGIAMLARELCEEVRVFTFSDRLVEVPLRRGFGLRDAIVGSQPHGSTYLGRAYSQLWGYLKVTGNPYDRIIILTDEQAHDNLGKPETKGYLINVASYQNGVGYHEWTHIDGFSEATLNYISRFEEVPEQPSDTYVTPWYSADNEDNED